MTGVPDGATTLSRPMARRRRRRKWWALILVIVAIAPVAVWYWPEINTAVTGVGAVPRCASCPMSRANYPWLPVDMDYEPLARRIPMPRGYHEVAVRPGSFGEWLRYIAVAPPGTPVRDVGGKRLRMASRYAKAVLAIDPREMQECADVVIRLRAEYLRQAGEPDKLVFPLTSGGSISWPRWIAGERPRLAGDRIVFGRTSERGDSREQFDDFLTSAFTWCGTISLARDGRSVSPEDIQPGDFVSRPSPGSTGHAMLIADVVEDDAGHHLALMVQGAMPAQTPHVALGHVLGAWVVVDPAGALEVPGWRPFEWTLLRRFR